METQPAPLDALDALPEVLQVTGISKPQLYKLVRLGAFPPPVKIGRSSRWPRSEIREWLEAKKAERTAGATA
jgi:predicted DNA-binding transcriptional regulator AlpA